ncbi:hypothetical protein BH10PSE4_BH10PSE4_03390 [soil metagenome]
MPASLAAAAPASVAGLRDILALADRRHMAVEHRVIAGAPAVVIDGVYADPWAVRRLALELDFQRPAGLYPGRFATVSIRPRGLEALLNDLLSPRLGRRLVFSPYYGDTTFAIIETPPDALVPLQRQPHYDTFCDFAGVVYLSRRGGAPGGTSFWRHRRTGLTRAPGERLSVAPETARAAERLLLEGITELPPGYPVETSVHWALTEVVDMRFNRLVAYDARAFHSPHITRFESPSDRTRARLTQSLFLDVVSADVVGDP